MTAAPPNRDPLRLVALGVLVVIHVLGILGAPIAASIHLWQPGATEHQNFHVVWEACKYATASLFALALVLGPVARGERWSLAVLGTGTFVLFGGVFFSHAMTHGGPLIDFWAYGSFFVLSAAALAILAKRAPSAATG